MKRRIAALVFGLMVTTILAVWLFTPASLAQSVIQLVSGTAVLLSQGSGGTSSVSSSTDIFAPAAYADYKRFGGEPTVVVDRYPITSGTFKGQTCTSASPCFPDLVYVSAPQGFVFPHYSYFWKSSDLGQSFRVPQHIPVFGENLVNGGGGGDSHQVVGRVTHKVFFADLPAQCVTVNTSTDFGENFTPDNLGCGLNPGTIDDRQWIEADETFPNGTGGNVYVSFINFTNLIAPTIALARSVHDGATASFATDSLCNFLTNSSGAFIQVPAETTGAPDSTPTFCPDPTDSRLQIAGPVVADKTTTSAFAHRIYIPFVRAHDSFGNPPFSLWVAISSNGGSTWTRTQVANLGCITQNPCGGAIPTNIFPQLTIDTGGNLYYTWAQTTGAALIDGGVLGPSATANLGGETDVFYTFSTNGGSSWVAPIDLTKETGDSAVFPWMVAGDPGQVDIAYYKANTGINPNAFGVDANGNACMPPGTTTAPCTANPSVWNVFFGRSNNALNTGPNFSSVQISDHPNHIGQICTSGLGCSNSGGNRNLLDFFTIDVDHLGAANVVWADDNNARSDTFNRFARQISGNSVFKNQTINLTSTWPITDHAVTDVAGDVFDGAGFSVGSCPGMDLLGLSESRSSGQITVTLTLNAPPTALAAINCSNGLTATGGIWGVEFWASAPAPSLTTAPNDNFYVAFRDNPPDGGPHTEVGRMNNVNLTITSLEFHPQATVASGVPPGTCFASPPPSGPCTIILTASESAFGIKSGTAMFSITGLSAYMFGTTNRPPLLRIEGGNSEQADATAPFDDNGSGTTQ